MKFIIKRLSLQTIRYHNKYACEKPCKNAYHNNKDVLNISEYDISYDYFSRKHKDWSDARIRDAIQSNDTVKKVYSTKWCIDINCIEDLLELIDDVGIIKIDKENIIIE